MRFSISSFLRSAYLKLAFVETRKIEDILKDLDRVTVLEPPPGEPTTTTRLLEELKKNKDNLKETLEALKKTIKTADEK